MAPLSLGWGVIKWIEHYLVHGPGDVQGDPIHLDSEFEDFIMQAYRVDVHGRRQIRRAFISRPKGRAKSELAGMLVCAEALGPVRFSHWDEDGRPVGTHVTAPDILCVATEESQAGNTYDNVVYMLTNVRDRFSDEYPGIDVGLSRCFLQGGGEISPVSAKARSKDGGRSTFAVFDETHLYETTELRGLHATIRRNLGKRKLAEPWSLETSTMYRPGMDSVAESTHEYHRQIADGRRKDTGLLFDHKQGPEDFDWNSDKELLGALKVAYGPAKEWIDLDRIVAEIRDPQSEEADSRRYWLNQVFRATEQAFDPVQWRELADPTHVVPDKALIAVGFDGARFNDATALVATEIETGFQWPLGIWEVPVNAPDSWEMPEDEVEQVLAAAVDRYNVWRVYADPPYWESAINRWVALFGEKRVIAWYTHRNRQMAFAIRAYVTAQRAGELSHDGASLMARHIANARRRDSRMKDEDNKPLWTISKEHPKSPNKIDAAVAGVLSWECRGDAIASGALREQDKTLYGF